jgi:predicted kinase
LQAEGQGFNPLNLHVVKQGVGPASVRVAGSSEPIHNGGMRLELVVFTGLQASGKTSFYRERFAETHVHISKDAWPNARRREERQRRLIAKHLSTGRSVVVDNTNPTPFEREPLIEIGRGFGALVQSYSFLVTMDEALCRNAGREGRARVPEIGIYSVARRLVAPGAGEGFDQMFEVTLAGGRFEVTRLSARSNQLDRCTLDPRRCTRSR